MTYEAHLNVICSMLYQRGDRLATPGLKTVSRRQVENVIRAYCEREAMTLTVREVTSCSTGRWSVESTQCSDRFLITAV